MIKPTKDIFNAGIETSEINENDFIDPQTKGVENVLKKQPTIFFNESFFIYDKSNIVKKSFLKEINKFLLLFGLISFSGSVKNNLLLIVSSEKPIEYFFGCREIKRIAKIPANEN